MNTKLLQEALTSLEELNDIDSAAQESIAVGNSVAAESPNVDTCGGETEKDS